MDQAGDVRGSGCDIFAEIGEIFAGTKSVPKGATTVYDSIGVVCPDVCQPQASDGACCDPV